MACLLALFASAAEIYVDLRPGAHHGAALLALSEVVYQFRRLQRIKGWGGGRLLKRSRSTKLPATFLGRVWQRMTMGTMIALAAAAFALTEVIEDLSPGAHHGVAILAAAECIENVQRSYVTDHATVSSHHAKKAT